MTRYYEFTKEEKKQEKATTEKAATEKTATEAGGSIRTDTYSTAGTETVRGAGTDCQKEILCSKNERFFLAGFYAAGCFFVSFMFLYGDCFQAVSRNIAHWKFLCISGSILPLCRDGGFRHYLAAAEKGSAGSGTNLSGIFIPHFHCGISGI